MSLWFKPSKLDPFLIFLFSIDFFPCNLPTFHSFFALHSFLNLRPLRSCSLFFKYILQNLQLYCLLAPSILIYLKISFTFTLKHLFFWTHIQNFSHSLSLSICRYLSVLWFVFLLLRIMPLIKMLLFAVDLSSCSSDFRIPVLFKVLCR